MDKKWLMQWVAEQTEYITRLAKLPWAGDQLNVRNIIQELEMTLRIVKENNTEA